MNARPTTPALAEPGAEPASPDRPVRVGPQLRFAAAGAVALALFVGTYLVFVTTDTGQRIENLALQGAELRDVGQRQAAQDVLSLVTLALFVLAVAGVFLAGLVLRRPGLGLAAAAIMVLSLAAAELMKALVDRPELAPGPAWILRNSFPSGTVTAASSMAVGVFLVAPNRLRWLLLPAGALFAAVVGHSVQASGWHRLSDSIAATTLVIGVACVGVALMARAGLVQRSEGGLIDRRVSRLLLVGSAGVLLVAIILLALPTAFPLLASPDGSRRAFLQTAFPLVGASLTVLLLTVFGLLVQPFALGSGRGGSDRRAWRLRLERAGTEGRAGTASGPAGAPADDTSPQRDGPDRPR
jgi:hypothetical protein